MQAQATPTNLTLFNNTTNQPAAPFNNPVTPERAHYFDVGVDQKLLEGLNVGVDAYSKIADNMIDDGQFGQAVVLTQFNWARGFSKGVEFKSAYQKGDFRRSRVKARMRASPVIKIQISAKRGARLGRRCRKRADRPPHI